MFTARTNGPTIVLEPVEGDDDSGDVWKPKLTLSELYRIKAELPEGFGKRMPSEKVRRVTL